MRPVGDILFEWEESKEEHAGHVQELIACAIEKGLDPRFAQESKNAVSFLKGYVKGFTEGRKAR